MSSSLYIWHCLGLVKRRACRYPLIRLLRLPVRWNNKICQKRKRYRLSVVERVLRTFGNSVTFYITLLRLRSIAEARNRYN